MEWTIQNLSILLWDTPLRKSCGAATWNSGNSWNSGTNHLVTYPQQSEITECKFFFSESDGMNHLESFYTTLRYSPTKISWSRHLEQWEQLKQLKQWDKPSRYVSSTVKNDGMRIFFFFPNYLGVHHLESFYTILRCFPTKISWSRHLEQWEQWKQ